MGETKDRAKLSRILINKLKGVPIVTSEEIVEELGEGALEELTDNKGEEDGIQ